MTNLPQPLSMNAAAYGGPRGGGGGGNKDRKMQSAEQLVLDLSNPDLRENALLELSKKRELFPDLAPLLWNSFGTIAALLQGNTVVDDAEVVRKEVLLTRRRSANDGAMERELYDVKNRLTQVETIQKKRGKFLEGIMKFLRCLGRGEAHSESFAST
ncbi:hypothetical protein LIER_31756 [Lithospermum erythrorhizon]|uniref:Uncharacterized protein n=1 Tax=Lithospermum erythrorhizon TaxID=34254 RepID=A0AAV3RS08_LITER